MKCLHVDATLTQLECLSRVGESEWTCEVVLPSVSFASLVPPSDEELKQLPVVEFSERSLYIHVYVCLYTFVELEPDSLKHLCRMAVLKHMTRQYYSLLPFLPLPLHLKVW